ncbi:hypothetical protein ARMSODRAFT_627564 [Armillaria solidipes]|uniref:Uncharacterized protein n=1 Tax=Armillaria solidipes TaxID=1076256 RepID=A0A2H3BWE4_9AGAR|nr:hypothetical protein ARMSODRAFT_627564 [Armillaria solidipes]
MRSYREPHTIRQCRRMTESWFSSSRVLESQGQMWVQRLEEEVVRCPGNVVSTSIDPRRRSRLGEKGSRLVSIDFIRILPRLRGLLLNRAIWILPRIPVITNLMGTRQRIPD